MSESSRIPDDLHDLIDDYLGGSLDEGRRKQLEARLRADAVARHFFVRYCQLNTDLALEARARQAGARALKAIDGQEVPVVPVRRFAGLARWGLPLAAAALVLAASAWFAWQAGRDTSHVVPPREELAWLVNAQNCQWADNSAPAGDMQAGKVLKLERGLAELRFHRGARVVIEGPASLEIISDNSARLHRGKLTAKVPDAAKGFQIITPQGKVVDLGTEFAVAVEEDGSADVHVYSGKVEAYANARQPAAFVNVEEKQVARIDAQGVALKREPPAPESKPFIREIPILVPRSRALDFQRPIAGTLRDAAGLGTGLTHRLPGTGKRLKGNDVNLKLNREAGQLELLTTNSDLNTQYKLDQGEYLGIKLVDVGFTGSEDFALTVVVPNIPALQHVGQFGLYAGVRSDRNIRGGLLSRKQPEQYRQFLVQNHGGKDAPPHYVGVTTPGDDLRFTLRREGRQYALTIENLTTGNSSILTMPQPAFLQGQRDMYVGFFGANTQSDVRRTLVLKEFKATVWTKAP